MILIPENSRVVRVCNYYAGEVTVLGCLETHSDASVLIGSIYACKRRCVAGVFGAMLAGLVFTATHAHLIAEYRSVAAEKAQRTSACTYLNGHKAVSQADVHLPRCVATRHAETWQVCIQIITPANSSLILAVCITQCPIKTPEHQVNLIDVPTQSRCSV